jgi:uncharacterized membrane protein YfcA
MDAINWAYLFVALFLAGIAKGATSIGFATCALPALAQVLDLKAAMIVAVAPTIAANLGATLSTGRIRGTLRRFLPLYAAMIPGVILGIWLLAIADHTIGIRALGAILAGYAALNLLKPKLQISEQSAQRLMIPVGMLTGTLTGLTGSQVFPLVPFTLALHMDAQRTTQVINIGVLILSTAVAVGLPATGSISADWLGLSLLGILPAVAGTFIGTALQAKIQPATLRKLIFLMLGLIGIKMLLS